MLALLNTTLSSSEFTIFIITESNDIHELKSYKSTGVGDGVGISGWPRNGVGVGAGESIKFNSILSSITAVTSLDIKSKLPIITIKSNSVSLSTHSLKLNFSTPICLSSPFLTNSVIS